MSVAVCPASAGTGNVAGAPGAAGAVGATGPAAAACASSGAAASGGDGLSGVAAGASGGDAAGPFADDTGALILVNGDLRTAEEVLAGDPYYRSTEGVRVVSVREWSPVVGP